MAEVDGRNGTRELVGSGYGGRIFLLSRPPGYGLEGVPTDPDPPPGAASSRTPRIAVRASRAGLEHLSPLAYGGGFADPTRTWAAPTLGVWPTRPTGQGAATDDDPAPTPPSASPGAWAWRAPRARLRCY